MLNNSAGEKIKKLREERNLTQAELGNMLGCAQNTVAQWEKGENRVPAKPTLGKIAEVFGVSIDFLLGMQTNTNTIEIPYYGEVESAKFLINCDEHEKYGIEIPLEYYKADCFALRIMDDLLEPTIKKGSYCILANLLPSDGDIVLASMEGYSIIRMWREDKEEIVLSQTNLNKIYEPYFLKKKNGKIYMKNGKKVSIEGKVIAVKRYLERQRSEKIQYIY